MLELLDGWGRRAGGGDPSKHSLRESEEDDGTARRLSPPKRKLASWLSAWRRLGMPPVVSPLARLSEGRRRADFRRLRARLISQSRGAARQRWECTIRLTPPQGAWAALGGTSRRATRPS